MLEDLNAMGSSLINLQKLQNGLDLNSLQGSNNMLSILDSLKFYEDDIEEANKAYLFRKYFFFNF